jgi:hypothetical protein
MMQATRLMQVMIETMVDGGVCDSEFKKSFD